MQRARTFLLPAAALIAGGAFLITQRGSGQPQSNVIIQDDAICFRVEFGVADTSVKAWDGKVSATGGQLVAVRPWRPRPGDSITGTSFHLASHKGINFTHRPWEAARLEPARPYFLRPGLIIDVKGAASRVRVESGDGAFEFSAADVPFGKTHRLNSGRVAVERVAVAQSVSGPQGQADFATLTTGSGGELWTAFVAFQNGRNAVVARRFDGTGWQMPQVVSDNHSDIHVVKAARDKSGRPWFVWSSQVNGNWDLYARTPGSPIARLTEDVQPDIYPVAAADSAGNLWVAWQGFRDGKSDIFVRRYDGSAWSAAERVSPSSANDWNAAIATGGDGSVWIGWDTYDKDDYDVYVRKYAGGQWAVPVPAANTFKYEAYPSLAVDKQNRLWVAWNESGYEWGKDTGFLPRHQGTPLYEWRDIRVAVLDGAQWKEPASRYERALPTNLRGYNDLPVLQADANGRMWLFFRHRLLRIQDTPPATPAHRAAWEIFGVSYDNDRWTEPVSMPFSNGRQDLRTGFAALSGGIVAAYPTDNRDFEEFLYKRSEVMVAKLPALPAPQGAQLRDRVMAELPRPRIHADEAGDLKRIRGAVIENAGRKLKVYRGDTHRHTEFSMDGNNDGSLLDTYRYAIDAASLDYLLVSEHNGNAGPDEEYVNWLLQQAADLFTVPGAFMPFYGYERSLGYPNGHRNVIFAKRGNPTLPIPVEEQKAIIGAKPLYEYLKKYNGIAISHTSASNMGTDWRDNDPQVEPLVEIYQGDRVSNEYEGAPKAAHTANLATAPGGFRPAGYVWNAWAKGYKLGVQVASDHLSTHISFACTLSPAFTRQALLESMRARQSYGATDNIVLDYQMEHGGQRIMQGGVSTATGAPRLSIRIEGTKPIRQIDIIRNNEFIHTRHPLAQNDVFTFTDPNPPAATKAGFDTYYYVRVQQVDEQIAWSSPIWIQKK
jgi:hypothetical protein